MPAGRPTELSAKQERFCREYVIDCIGKLAAIRAGYSEKTAEQQASRLLRNVKVSKRIDELQKIVEKKLDISKERIAAEYAKLGFTNSEDLFDWKEQVIEVLDPVSGDKKEEVVAKPFLKRYEDMSDTAKAAISEIRETNQGIVIKMHDKRAALDSLAKIQGYLSDKHEISGKDCGPIETNFTVNFVKREKK